MNPPMLPIEPKVLSPERRRQLLDDYFQMEQGLSEIRDMARFASGPHLVRLVRHQEFYLQWLTKLRTDYIAGLQALWLSRCPFTGKLMQHSVDHFGLDGLWWDYEAPARPKEKLLPTYFALTGALRLRGPVPWTSFLCRPGPEVPYVVPRLLEHPSIVAVLSPVAVSEHQGYAIPYFANPVAQDIPRINTWGANGYLFFDEEGQQRWSHYPYDPRDFDFDLEPWIRAGRLRWIAPRDRTLTLHDTVSGCPYLGLSGQQAITHTQRGRAWQLPHEQVYPIGGTQ